MDRLDGARARSDALVLFGVTGDLAHKMIFPALYAMAKRGALDVPVIGVASSALTLDAIARARRGWHQGIRKDRRSGRALRRCCRCFNTSAATTTIRETFAALEGSARRGARPAHYLAIPPALFATVIQGLGAAGLAADARVIVEKPFGRDLASARELNRVARSVFPEDCDLPHRSLPRARKRS